MTGFLNYGILFRFLNNNPVKLAVWEPFNSDPALLIGAAEKSL